MEDSLKIIIIIEIYSSKKKLISSRGYLINKK